MDSLTQIVLGASVGEAALGKKIGNKAMLYGALAGTIPDLDALAGYFTDPVTAIEIHRGLSHSILFSVVAAPVLGWLVSNWERKSSVSWSQWSWLFFWGLFTHPLLDALTTWGTQLFWPLDYRIAVKSIFVIDPLYTLPFLVFLLMAMRCNRKNPRRRRYNRLGLLISSGYLLLGLIFKGIAVGNFEDSLQKQGIFYERMETRPTPLNTLLWAANVEVEDAFLVGEFSLLNPALVRFEVFQKNHHYLGSLKEDPTIERLIKITNGWYSISEKNGFLYFNDLRFGQLDPTNPDSSFTFSYKIIPEDGQVRIEEVEKRTEDASKLLGSLWARIWGKEYSQKK